MAPPKSILSLVHARVYNALGAPELPVEMQVSEEDIEAALVKYYSFVPIKEIRTYGLNGQIFAQSQPIDELLPSEDYFYVGVFSFAVRNQLSANNFNEYLLGLPMMGTWSPEEKLRLDTKVDMMTGDPYYRENFVEGKIEWVVGSMGQLSVVYGLGHTNVELIPRRHVELMAYLTSEVYYERMLAIRKMGSFGGADFTLDVAQLQAALDYAKSRGTEILESIALVPATLG